MSVKSLGTRLEDIESTKSRRVKHYKRKLQRAEDRYIALKEHCEGLEKDLGQAVNSMERLRTDYIDTKNELDRLRLHMREREEALRYGANESSKLVFDPSDVRNQQLQ